jgi:hypothetical protein
MLFSSWLRTGKRSSSAAHRRTRNFARPCVAFRPLLEALEERTLPSNYTADSVSALIADINAANQAGGTNTIYLASPTPTTAAVVFDLTTVNNTSNGANGLPVISGGGKKAAADNLTINGTDQGGDIIDRSLASGTPSFRLFDVANGSSLTLENVTLEGGLAQGSGAAADGGAIYNQGTLTLNGAIVQGNTAQGSNGAAASTIVIKNKTYYIAAQPGVEAEGGGIWSSGSVTLENGTTLQSNKAIGGQGGSARFSGDGGNGLGGGLYVAGGSVNASGTGNESGAIFSGNEALGGAGGGSTPSDNPGRGGNGSGGGLYVAGGSVSAIGTSSESAALFSGNEALGGAGGIGYIRGTSFSYQFPWGGNGSGGGLYVAGGTLDMSRDTVQSNKAVGGKGGGERTYTDGAGGMGGTGIGGGLFVAGTGVVVTLADVNLSSNLAQGGQGGNGGGQGGNAYGGSLSVGGGTVTLTGDMVTGNQAIGGFPGLSGFETTFHGEGSGAGDGIYVFGGTVTVGTSVFSANSPDNIYGPYTDGGGNTFS